MKTPTLICSLLYLFAFALPLWASTPPDSVIVNFGDSKMTVYLANSQDAEKLQKMDLNTLAQRITKYLQEPNDVNATISDESGTYKITKTNGNTKVFYERVNTPQPERKDKNIKITWDFSRKETTNHKTLHTDFGIDVGLNGFAQTSDLANTPYVLDAARSRYVALNSFTRFNLNKTGSLRFKVGLQVAWYNFMFDRSAKLQRQDTGLEFVDIPNLQKSKLAASYLDIPIFLEVGTRRWLNFGIGGYVGYNITSWTKIKYSNGQKEHDRQNYFLTPFRYGVSAQVGIGSVKVFANYDLNELFLKDKNAPQINAFSFGLRIN